MAPVPSFIATWKESLSTNTNGFLMSQIHKYETVQEDRGFKPKQPQRIISGLRETFIKRCIAERTNKAEIRLEEQSVKVESWQMNLWNEIQLKGP